MFEYSRELFLSNLCPAFKKPVKDKVHETQHGECAMCHEVVEVLEIHHRVPKNGLQWGRDGVRGTDGLSNAVGLCSGENGGGENSDDDCHEKADQKALHERLFFVNGEFVPLSQVPATSYHLVCNPEKVEEKHKKHHNKKHN